MDFLFSINSFIDQSYWTNDWWPLITMDSSIALLLSEYSSTVTYVYSFWIIWITTLIIYPTQRRVYSLLTIWIACIDFPNWTRLTIAWRSSVIANCAVGVANSIWATFYLTYGTAPRYMTANISWFGTSFSRMALRQQ